MNAEEYEIQKLTADLDYQVKATMKLVDRISEGVGTCKSCGKQIWWVKHAASGTLVPYDHDGVMHAKRCNTARTYTREGAQRSLYEGTR